MLSKETNKNIQELFNGGIISNSTLDEILRYMNFYNREEYYVGGSDGKFFLFDSQPDIENFHITKEGILNSLKGVI